MQGCSCSFKNICKYAYPYSCQSNIVIFSTKGIISYYKLKNISNLNFSPLLTSDSIEKTYKTFLQFHQPLQNIFKL